jgi:transcription elongation factor
MFTGIVAAVGRTSSSNFGACTPAWFSTQLVLTLTSPQQAASASMPRTSRKKAA